MAGSLYRQQLILDILAWAAEATPEMKDRVVETLVEELGAAVAAKVETLVVEIVAEIAEKVATQATATTTTTARAERTTMAATTDGWVLVPSEPTAAERYRIVEAMLAGFWTQAPLPNTVQSHAAMAAAYDAMISAAPPPPVSEPTAPSYTRSPRHEA